MDSFPIHLPPIYHIYCREITPVDSTRVHTHTNATLKAQWLKGLFHCLTHSLLLFQNNSPPHPCTPLDIEWRHPYILTYFVVIFIKTLTVTITNGNDSSRSDYCQSFPAMSSMYMSSMSKSS